MEASKREREEGEGREQARGRRQQRCSAKKRTGSACEWKMKAMGEEKERKEEKLGADRIDWK